jgi:phage shock protein PspC (stress-responsive transcriptional regulator)
MISGICNGIAAYLNVDPTIVRLAFVIATIFTGGAGILAYLVMIWVIPVASTDAEKNAASGTSSFTAQEFIRRARAGYYEGMRSFPDREARREWKRKFKEDMRAWRRSFNWEAKMGAHTWQRHWQGYWAEHPYFETGCGAAMPFLTLFNAGLALAFIVILVSLLTNGTVIGQELPGGTPVWLAVVILLFAYNLVVWPLKAARHAFYYHGVFGARPGPRMMVTLWDSLIWLAFLGVLAWLASRHFPQVQEAVHNIPSVFHEAVDSVQHWWAHR